MVAGARATEKTAWQKHVDAKPHSYVPEITSPPEWSLGDDDTDAFAMVNEERVALNAFFSYNLRRLGLVQ